MLWKDYDLESPTAGYLKTQSTCWTTLGDDRKHKYTRGVFFTHPESLEVELEAREWGFIIEEVNKDPRQ